MIIIILAFFFRVLLTIFNIEISVIPGAEYDANAFHLEAVAYSEHLDRNQRLLLNEPYELKGMGWGYSLFLGTLFNFFGTTSHLLSSIISCIAWLFSALTFRKIILKLRFKEKHIAIAILCYCFIFPTSIVYTSLTLREVFMLLFFNLLVLLIINICEAKNIMKKFFDLFFIIISCTALYHLHVANMYFIIFFVPLIFIFFFIDVFNLNVFKWSLATLLITIVFFSYNSEYIEKAFILIQNYQIGHFDPSEINRANYFTNNNIVLEDLNLINLVLYMSRNLYYYLFHPTMFSATNLKDFILLFENIIRFILLSFIFKNFFL